MKESEMIWPDYETLEYRLIAANTPFSMAYVHGMMVGLLCVSSRSPQQCWPLIQEKIPILDAGQGTLVDLINKVFTLTVEHLRNSEKGMVLMLPDELPLGQRLEALVDWCEGFLIGIKLENLPSGALLRLPLVIEVIEDLEKIKDISFDACDTPENQNDYLEIVEFVRIGALLVYAECAQNGSFGTQKLH